MIVKSISQCSLWTIKWCPTFLHVTYAALSSHVLNFFQQHRKEHAQSNGVTLFTCEHCPFECPEQFNLNWHNMLHTKGQEHKCEICAPNEVSRNIWSNPLDIDSDAISSIDCSRFGKRSIATQYYDEDVDANAEPYPLTGELDYDDDETEEELEEDDYEQETEEDDAATQIEDEQESNYFHQNGYDHEKEDQGTEEFDANVHNNEEYSQINTEDFNHEDTEVHQEDQHLNDDNEHQTEIIDHQSDNRFAQNDNNLGATSSLKIKTSRKRSKQKTKNNSFKDDVYDFKSDDDAQLDSHSLPTRTPSRSSSSLSHPCHSNGQILLPNENSDQRGMLVVSSHSAQSDKNNSIQTTQASSQQTASKSQVNNQPSSTHLLQTAPNQGPFMHPNMHPQIHRQDGQNSSNGQPIQTFSMPQRFFTLPQPAPFGTVPGPQQHPQFIANPAQFQPGGQIQLVSIPANMQHQNAHFLPPTQPPAQGHSHNLSSSQPHLSFSHSSQVQPSQEYQQQPQQQQQFSDYNSVKSELNSPVVIKAKKTKSKPAVLLPSPSSNNLQTSCSESDVKQENDTQTTPSSPIKPKGHGKGNRKPRINFVSLANGITIGTDGIRRKFHCSHCGNGKSFKTKSHLQRHMLTHTGEKPYQCNDCGSKFNQSSSLRNHMIAIHTKKFPHSCQVCGKGFLMPAVLQRHIQQTGHIADEESSQENSNGSNAISTNENISTFNNIITPIRQEGYFQPTFNNPNNVMMAYSYAPTT